ncbi:hypothetical protein DCE93_13100 [Agromyces badenianii]|uniref:Uncharacterized protein n=1 Tax=Agromyces badenianii TaxID=2080742 RepID=A0A2S0WYM9_9MICO|nr:sugar ABC transporter permease [Agromyces badenianii]AWB96469.1 hypothetical protein DCE93_13100 [Agromyces badenianii]PWC05327.1 sugar ABC transporter permease [Agromyces badenianii]
MIDTIAPPVAAPPSTQRPRPPKRPRNGEARIALSFISPSLAFFVVFWALPLIATIGYSMTSWRVGSDPEWIGLDNYFALASDPLFHRSVAASLTISVGASVVSLAIALGLAAVLAQPAIRGGRLWRLAIILPVVTDWVATGLVFQLIFLPNQGVLASLAASVGAEALINVPWVSDRTLAPIAVSIFIIWKQTGLYTIFFFAGIRSIPDDVIEAARLDGASAWAVFWRIRWPMMKPITVFVVVTAFVTTLGLFEPVFMLTGGGPAGETRTLPIFLYENFFSFGNSGYASAAGVVFLLISLAFALVASRMLKESYES